jgi:putative transposase
VSFQAFGGRAGVPAVAVAGSLDECAHGDECGGQVEVEVDDGGVAVASRKYWTPLAKDLRTIYTAADEAAAAAALEAFAATWGERYPAIIKLWRAHWAEFTPFLAFPPEVRRVIYTTNLIESMNARLRKVTRNRGQFPSEQAALKVLYLAVRNLEEFRRPNVGIRSSGWKQALQAFTIYFEGRIPTP